MVNLEARVLVCDPNNSIFPEIPAMLDKRFGEGTPPNSFDVAEMDGSRKGQYGGVEYTVVDDMATALEKVKDRQSPYYSLVVYESNQVKEECGGIGRIADVRKHDFFLPQMVLGMGLEVSKAAQCARAGALYFAEHTGEAETQINKIFQRPSRLSNLTVVKIGGSSYDFDRQVKDNFNFEHICRTLSRIHDERGNTRKTRRVNRMIVTVGAGQHGDIIKEHTAKYHHNGSVNANYPKAMANALQSNLENLKPLFGEKAALINTGAFYYIGKHSTSKRIPLIGTAPHYVMVRDNIPLQDSDTHTIALADFYGAERVVLIKRTDGIYNFDPYREFILDPVTGKCASHGEWKFEQEGNKRYETVNINEMLSGKEFSREGTAVDGKADGSTGHLMEDSALAYMQKCNNVKEVVVVHIAPEEMYYKKDGQYKHIVTGETKPSDTNWKSVLEQNIRDAFQGKANSKIVRD